MSDMLVKVGANYTFPIGAADFGITRDVLRTEALQPYAIKHKWAFDIFLVGIDPVAVEARIQDLYAAFVDGQDFRLTMPNGGTNSSHVLLNAGSVAGVLVNRLPSVTTFKDAGGCTNICCTAEVEAEYPINISATVYANFEETLNIEGGGAQAGFLLPLYGSPQKQTLRQNDSYRATQIGSAVGMWGRPPIPPPTFPNDLMCAPKISRRSGKLYGAISKDFYISWEYRFESDSPLEGEPNEWPI